MLISNIKQFENVPLYKCDDKNIYMYLLKNGLEPVFVEDSEHYFIENELLIRILSNYPNGGVLVGTNENVS
jgi:Tfp pilus assembly protein PilZ